MTAAVPTAYGWTDLLPKRASEFLLDYEDEDGEDFETAGEGDHATGALSPSLPVSKSQGRRRRKPWRYRWPDEIRDEVLARLLKLSVERAEEERLAGLAKHGGASPSSKGGPRKLISQSKRPTTFAQQPELFG